MFALAMALWKSGRQFTAGSLLLIGLLCIVTLTVKFSGIVAVMLVPLLLGLRALSPEIWPVFGKNISTRLQRLAVAIGITAICAAVSFAGIWAVYGFRFRPTPQADVWLNLDQLTQQIRVNTAIANHQSTAAANQMPNTARAAIFANRHGLFPQAYIADFCSPIPRRFFATRLPPGNIRSSAGGGIFRLRFS